MTDTFFEYSPFIAFLKHDMLLAALETNNIQCMYNIAHGQINHIWAICGSAKC